MRQINRLTRASIVIALMAVSAHLKIPGSTHDTTDYVVSSGRELDGVDWRWWHIWHWDSLTCRYFLVEVDRVIYFPLHLAYYWFYRCGYGRKEDGQTDYFGEKRVLDCCNGFIFYLY
jgi:hypothetical protein